MGGGCTEGCGSAASPDLAAHGGVGPRSTRLGGRRRADTELPRLRPSGAHRRQDSGFPGDGRPRRAEGCWELGFCSWSGPGDLGMILNTQQVATCDRSTLPCELHSVTDSLASLAQVFWKVQLGILASPWTARDHR